MKSPASGADNLLQTQDDVTSRVRVDQCISAIMAVQVNEVKKAVRLSCKMAVTLWMQYYYTAYRTASLTQDKGT